ncbi:MAG: Rid family detoxifying hydrolase [Verrucomicrobiota bacterium]|nr:Rid family detoxifying hydrolase [Verrucomicrobiota bacterium]
MNAIQTSRAPAAIGPYSQAVSHGQMLYLSGQLGLNPETGELARGVEAQTRQALANVQAILEAEGLTPRAVLKMTLYVVDMNDFALINAVYAETFTEPFPAREVVQVARLPKDGLIEISGIAAYGVLDAK